MSIYRHKGDGKLYTLHEVRRSLVMSPWLEAEPYGHHGLNLGAPNGRKRIKREDFTLVGER